jgi:hypothetical protein
MPWDNNVGFHFGPWWLRLTVGPYGNGWTLRFRRYLIAWRPIDYDKTVIVNGVRKWGYPRIAALDLRGRV